ncbi:MAG: hypothetical protein ACOZNI_17555 [Myxococcota bacterium]
MLLLVCPWDDTCDADAAFVAKTADAGDPAPVTLSLALEQDDGGWVDGVDLRRVYGEALMRAEDAAAKRRWGAVLDETATALEALKKLRGTVSTQSLYTLHFLRGAASRARGDDQAYAYSFRQAAAISQGQEVKLPPHDEDTLRAYQDEARKLVVGGTGTLNLGDPGPGVRYVVNGRELPEGPQQISLLPGNHRVGATSAKALRTWQVEVPVLAGRTIDVTAAFSPADAKAWVQARLEESFDRMAAPPEVTGMLRQVALRHGVDQLEIVRVEWTRPGAVAGEVHVGSADPLRPAAAAGEKADFGDGIPSTYEEEVAAVAEAPRRTEGEPRLRVVWFDPATQRFSATPKTTPRGDDPTRFRVGVALGYVGMLDHPHGAGDVAAAYRVGPVDVEGRLGVAVAETPYNYRSGPSPVVWHVTAAARWAPDWRVAPYASLGPEVWIPMSVGGRLAVGGQMRVDGVWLVQIEVAGSASDVGLGWATSAGVGRSY